MTRTDPPSSHDLAIYMPQAWGLYQRDLARSGGAERQTHLLATALAQAGLRVAHIVFAMDQFVPPTEPRLEIAQRPPKGRHPGEETHRVWRALAEADAQTYVVRTATPALGIVGLFCRLRGRRLIFCGANDGDFTFDTISRPRVPLYRLGARMADAIVVQSAHQLELAATTFPHTPRRIEIPSFVDQSDQAPIGTPTAFLWIGRLVDYKQPLAYLDLAAAVPEAKFRMVRNVTDDSSISDEVSRRAAGLANVELLDARPHRETMELIAEAVAVVNTSTLEGMPNVFLEAWTHGLPVVSLQFDPDGRIQQHGLGVVARGSWERFVAATRELGAGRENHAHYRRAAEAYLQARHSSAAVTAQWLNLIETLR